MDFDGTTTGAELSWAVKKAFYCVGYLVAAAAPYGYAAIKLTRRWFAETLSPYIHQDEREHPVKFWPKFIAGALLGTAISAYGLFVLNGGRFVPTIDELMLFKDRTVMQIKKDERNLQKMDRFLQVRERQNIRDEERRKEREKAKERKKQLKGQRKAPIKKSEMLPNFESRWVRRGAAEVCVRQMNVMRKIC